MTQKVIQWGIIGAGKIAKKFAQDLRDVPNAELYAIASRNADKAEKFASIYGAKISYGSYEESILDSNIDAIYIATPHSFHEEHTILCLEHQIPVLCEKPFAMNLKEAEQMIKKAKANDTLLMEAMWTAFLPHFQYVQDLIKRKYYGSVISLEADFGFHSKYDETTRLFDKSIGGGSLLDIGIYPIFAALSTLGTPNSIEAKATFFENGADSECSVKFNYNKCKAYLKSTLIEETKTEAIWICENGTIKINGRFQEPSSVTVIDKSGHSKLKTFNYTTIGYNYEIEHFNQLIRASKKESDIMSFKKSVELISTLDKIREIIGLEY